MRIIIVTQRIIVPEQTGSVVLSSMNRRETGTIHAFDPSGRKATLEVVVFRPTLNLVAMQTTCARRATLTSARMLRSHMPALMVASPLFFATLTTASSALSSLHTLEGKAIDASKISMSAFAGKPVLIVNVASR